ncbi:PDZ and LIM domain protein 5b isoform X2 [Salvelinus namaycush]|uniref:PDZ and LIM domain protein 5b isoform X2 n=1 Tax=Salvelinus namaycush TaxID=8040 RepID=A0A8U0PNY9_SALNM|nr:PDZ and LIM domain protein 5b isoform X2 [Salvelinus namaycush]
MSSNYSVSLVGPAPWGFRLQGGKDFCLPLTISRLTDGGKAAKARMSVGDVVLSIDGIATNSMNHLEAQNKIKACTDNLNLTLQKASSVPKADAPKAQPPFPLGSHSRSPAPPIAAQPSSAPPTRPSSGRSPFTTPSSSSSSSPARVTAPSSNPGAPQSSCYNTPINLYSNSNACEVAIGQRRGLLEVQGVVVDQIKEQFNGNRVEPEVIHASPLSEASKKRMIEDTEDWHPRTGTSQSRSFRILAQITGTENDQAQENSTGKKEVVEDALPSAHVTSVKTMTKVPGAPRNGTGVPPPTFKTPSAQIKPSWPAGASAGFPKGGAAPSFGRVSNTAPVPKGPDRPAPQAHPKDQDSLVQRAEHIAAGTRTPMCGHCDKVIRGPFLVAMGMSWHPEEFNCSHCHASLVESGFVEERGTVYCAHCYEEFFAPTCTSCKQKVLGEVINALKQTWHVYCFLCASCQQPIRNNTFHMEDGLPYCERDYYQLFGTSCHGCDFPIEAGDKFLEALGFTWHDTCFVCAVCSTSLEGQAFFSKKDKALCKKHAHTV